MLAPGGRRRDVSLICQGLRFGGDVDRVAKYPANISRLRPWPGRFSTAKPAVLKARRTAPADRKGGEGCIFSGEASKGDQNLLAPHGRVFCWRKPVKEPGVNLGFRFR